VDFIQKYRKQIIPIAIIIIIIAGGAYFYFSGTYNGFLRDITKWQYNLRKWYVMNLKEMKKEFNLILTFTILGISFVYGVIHSLGPGHGKAVISSYFISTGEVRKVRAFKIGYLISSIHALSALSITMIIYYVMKIYLEKRVMLQRSFDETALVITKISGIIIILAGIYLIYETFFRKENEHHKLSQVSKKRDFAIALSVGIVPCPGVMMIVLFAINMGKLYLGILSAICMSIGMGFTISLIGVAVIKLKHKLGEGSGKISLLLNITGVSFIFIMGIFLLVL